MSVSISSVSLKKSAAKQYNITILLHIKIITIIIIIIIISIIIIMIEIIYSIITITQPPNVYK